METIANLSSPVAKDMGTEKTYILTEKQLWNLLSSVLTNISLTDNQDKVVHNPELSTRIAETSTANMTSLTDDNLTDEDKMMIFYTLIFFVWYSALIFACLIGFGVYKTPSSYQIYKKFVDREELRQKLKEEKMSEYHRRKSLRQNSFVSLCTSPSSASELSNSCNGTFFSSSHERGALIISTSLGLGSSVHKEEEESLLDNQQNSKIDKLSTNGRVVFEM